MVEDFQSIVDQIKVFQEKEAEVREALAGLRARGESGAGQVKLEVGSNFSILRLSIHPDLLKGDVEVLQDLIIAANVQAVEKMNEIAESKLDELLPLPDQMPQK